MYLLCREEGAPSQPSHVSSEEAIKLDWGNHRSQLIRSFYRVRLATNHTHLSLLVAGRKPRHLRAHLPDCQIRISDVAPPTSAENLYRCCLNVARAQPHMQPDFVSPFDWCNILHLDCTPFSRGQGGDMSCPARSPGPWIPGILDRIDGLAINPAVVFMVLGRVLALDWHLASRSIWEDPFDP